MKNTATDIIHQAIKKEATEKDPMELAAAVLYMSYFNNNIKVSDISRRRRDASNQDTGNRSQTSFAQTAGVTDITLRHTIKDLKNRLHLLN